MPRHVDYGNGAKAAHGTQPALVTMHAAMGTRPS
jgi:hypothetical protein